MALVRKLSLREIEVRRVKRTTRRQRRSSKDYSPVLTLPRRKSWRSAPGQTLFERVLQPPGYGKPQGQLAPVVKKGQWPVKRRSALPFLVAAAVLVGGIIVLT